MRSWRRKDIPEVVKKGESRIPFAVVHGVLVSRNTAISVVIH